MLTQFIITSIDNRKYSVRRIVCQHNPLKSASTQASSGVKHFTQPSHAHVFFLTIGHLLQIRCSSSSSRKKEELAFLALYPHI
jgi:hypothetical protein